MNKKILNIENQNFINNNISSNINQLLLKGKGTLTANISELIQQIEAKKRCEIKLKTWFNSRNIYYPNKLNIEQTSSEITAEYKANLVSGDSLIDLTGGFGVDCYYFSKRINQVFHCEINSELSQIVSHNYHQLNIETIKCFPENGISILEQEKRHFDWIYIDPSRRNNSKEKVFLLKDCLPNVPEQLDLLFKYSKNVMIKTSPLLDITSGILELCCVKTIHSIAINNEVKELLWILERDYNKPIEIKTINIKKEHKQIFNFFLNEEPQAHASLSLPLTFLYEPNAAILKAGAFNVLAETLELKKLHKHSHLYTSTKQIQFPGRCFKINNVIDYNKKKFKREFKSIKANVSIRNFPSNVKQIREKLNLKDGGDDYLFFTTDFNNNKIIICCEKY